jgi:nitrile hydratase accessory protein
LNQSDPLTRPERLAALPPLPRDTGGPAFSEPWEAQAFALAVKLSEQGYFTWKEWASTLADELKAAADRGEPDDGSRYYHYWLAALERLVTSKGLLDRDTLATRKAAWAEAYEHTPHGQPVETGSGFRNSTRLVKSSSRPIIVAPQLISGAGTFDQSATSAVTAGYWGQSGLRPH